MVRKDTPDTRGVDPAGSKSAARTSSRLITFFFFFSRNFDRLAACPQHTQHHTCLPLRHWYSKMPRGLTNLSALVARSLSSTSAAVKPKNVSIQTRRGRIPEGPGLAYFIAGDGDQATPKLGESIGRQRRPLFPCRHGGNPSTTIRGKQAAWFFW